jgi:hypothetical protein
VVDSLTFLVLAVKRPEPIATVAARYGCAFHTTRARRKLLRHHDAVSKRRLRNYFNRMKL